MVNMCVCVWVSEYGRYHVVVVVRIIKPVATTTIITGDDGEFLVFFDEIGRIESGRERGENKPVIYGVY